MFENTGFVLVAGGSARRFGGGNKLLQILAGKPVIRHAVDSFAPLFPRENFIVVVPEAEMALFRSVLGGDIILTAGGADRNASVDAGLAALPKSGIDYVAIHDAARPCAAPELLKKCLDAARRCGAALPGHPLTDTVKRCDAELMIRETPPREELFAVETPQVFKLAALLSARKLAGKDFCPTDDAAFAEKAGLPVQIVLHNGENRKITTPDDLEYLRWKLSQSAAERT